MIGIRTNSLNALKVGAIPMLIGAVKNAKMLYEFHALLRGLGQEFRFGMDRLLVLLYILSPRYLFLTHINR
jgi:hypothetical protein